MVVSTVPVVDGATEDHGVVIRDRVDRLRRDDV
jgi:hypothetical protein